MRVRFSTASLSKGNGSLRRAYKEVAEQSGQSGLRHDGSIGVEPNMLMDLPSQRRLPLD